MSATARRPEPMRWWSREKAMRPCLIRTGPASPCPSPTSGVPLLLTTRQGLAGIDMALDALSDEELDALVERARSRGHDLPDAAVAALIGEALRAVRVGALG